MVMTVIAVLMVMIMVLTVMIAMVMMRVTVAMRIVVIVMMEALARPGTARILAEYQRFNRHRDRV